MNQDLTNFMRMVCPVGHRLSWRGKWRHIDRNVVYCAHTDATFPRYYFKVGAKRGQS